jgi:hypothetical protein
MVSPVIVQACVTKDLVPTPKSDYGLLGGFLDELQYKFENGKLLEGQNIRAEFTPSSFKIPPNKNTPVSELLPKIKKR